MPSTFNSSLGFQKYLPCVLSKPVGGNHLLECKLQDRVQKSCFCTLPPLLIGNSHPTGWHRLAWAGEDGQHQASDGLEEVWQVEGGLLLFCKGAFCRQASWA